MSGSRRRGGYRLNGCRSARRTSLEDGPWSRSLRCLHSRAQRRRQERRGGLLQALLGTVLGGSAVETLARPRGKDKGRRQEQGPRQGPGQTRGRIRGRERRIRQLRPVPGSGPGARPGESAKQEQEEAWPRNGGAPPPSPDNCCGTESCPDPEPGSTRSGWDFAGRSFVGQNLNGSMFRGIDGRESSSPPRTTTARSSPKRACRGPLPAGEPGRQHLGRRLPVRRRLHWGGLRRRLGLFQGAASAGPSCRTARSTTAIATDERPAASGSRAPAPCRTPADCPTRPAGPRRARAASASSRRSPTGQSPTGSAPRALLRGRVLSRRRHRVQPAGAVLHPQLRRQGVRPGRVRRGRAAPARKGRPALTESGTCICNPGTCDGCCAEPIPSASRGPRPRPAARVGALRQRAAGSRSATTGSAARRTARATSAVRTGAAVVAAVASRASAATQRPVRLRRAKLPQRLLRCQRRLPAGDREPGLRRRRRALRDVRGGAGLHQPGVRGLQCGNVPARLLRGGQHLPAGQRLPALRRAGRRACAACSDTQTCQNRQCVECGDSCPCSGQSICFNAGAPNVVCPLIPSNDLGECFVTLTGQPICSSNSSNIACNTDADCRELRGQRRLCPGQTAQ